MKYKKIYANALLLSTIIFLSACSKNQESLNKIGVTKKIEHPKVEVKMIEINEINDLKQLSQNPSIYTTNLPKFNLKSGRLYFRKS